MAKKRAARLANASEGIHTEEDVKFKFLVPYLEARGYKQAHIDFNVAIEVHEGRKKTTIFADAIVYTNASRNAPLIVCETKSPTEILDRQAREQAISYARLLPRIAPLVLLTNGSQAQVFHTLHKSRKPELPLRGELDNDILKFVLDKEVEETLRNEAKHDLFIIDDVRTFKNILKACHNEIRNNEGLALPDCRYPIGARCASMIPGARRSCVEGGFKLGNYQHPRLVVLRGNCRTIAVHGIRNKG